jgi:hypothetical protein
MNFLLCAPWPSKHVKYTMLFISILIAIGMWTGWVWGLDTFTLMLHEAGHPIMGMISSRLTVYGGTIFQLMFPCLVWRHFHKLDNAQGQIFAQAWLAASLHNVGMYMKDARAKELPLIGGLDPEMYHDWAEIFSRWHVLNADTFIGSCTILISWVLLGWTMYQGFINEVSDSKSFSGN